MNTLHAQLSVLFCRLLLYQPFLPPSPSNSFPSPHPSLFLPSLLLLVLLVFIVIPKIINHQITQIFTRKSKD
nr:hypothetical protein GZ9C4_4 [uncultured archaeon GZfos9C4]